MATPFRPAVDLLAQYATYHRDRRNILTHFVGVPMIVFSVGVLLSGLRFNLVGLGLSLAWLVFAVTALWYLSRGHFAIGMASSVGVGVLIALAHLVDAGSGASWAAWWIGFFTAGWIIQFVGHYYEGRKPAFADDLVGLLVGPMFVVLEMLAPLGMFKVSMTEIERRAGPTHIRDLAGSAT